MTSPSDLSLAFSWAYSSMASLMGIGFRSAMNFLTMPILSFLPPLGISKNCITSHLVVLYYQVEFSLKQLQVGMKEMQDISGLYQEVREIIASARQNAVRSVDFCRVQMYWQIGRRILEEEQKGKERADYGSYLLKNLAKKLEPEYGSGFSVRQLEMCRQFYRIYPIANTVCSQLNWSHCVALW